MGTYETLRAEKVQFAGELDAALVAMAGMKDVLVEREKSLEQAREANKALTAEVEKMKAQRSPMGQMNVLNKRYFAWTRGQVPTWERSIRENIPLDEDANRDLPERIRRAKLAFHPIEKSSPIDKELWPEDESRHEMEGLMTRLEEVPNRVQSWKKSAVRCGADVALSLVRVHCKEVREEKLKALKVANMKKLRFEDFMETFLESATDRRWIDLDIRSLHPAPIRTTLKKTFTSEPTCEVFADPLSTVSLWNVRLDVSRETP
ncbi:hypothetical protein ZWY2020_009724 [Hordeum vulgare]|nr:hypothetical protein ZWY2020_009724 [Hordeum vulgare]